VEIDTTLRFVLLASALCTLTGCGPYIGPAYNEWATTCAEPEATDFEAFDEGVHTLTEELELTRDSTTDWLPLGFEMPFFDDDVTDFYVSSNGFVGFADSDKHGCCEGLPLAEADGREGLVALGWTDLNVEARGAISWGTMGDETVWIRFDEVAVTGQEEAPEVNLLTGMILLNAGGTAALHVDHFDSGGLLATQGAESILGFRGVCSEERVNTPLSLNQDGVLLDLDVPAP